HRRQPLGPGHEPARCRPDARRQGRQQPDPHTGRYRPAQRDMSRRALRTLRARLRSAPQAGFTLIEVVVASALAAIVIGATAALFVTGSNSALGTQRQSQLLAVANQQIESVRQLVKTS